MRLQLSSEKLDSLLHGFPVVGSGHILVYKSIKPASAFLKLNFWLPFQGTKHTF